MTDQLTVPPSQAHESSPVSVQPTGLLPPDLEGLAPDIKSSIYATFYSLFRSSTGPDPETAKIVAETERHEETCRLDGYKQQLVVRDKQSERDHEFRKKRLNHATVLAIIIMSTCVVGVIAGLYLLVAKGQTTVGTGILVACFSTLTTGKFKFKKEDDDD